jgi:hypothetical protein
LTIGRRTLFAQPGAAFAQAQAGVTPELRAVDSQFGLGPWHQPVARDGADDGRAQAQATQQSISTFLSLINMMREVPHPQAPDLPLLADARLDLVPFLYRAFDFLKRELTYAGQYGDSSGSFEPAELNPIERARANAGLDVAAGSAAEPDFVPDTAQPGAGGGSLAAGVPQPDRRFERDARLPGPGTTLASDPAGSGLPGVLPFGGAQLPASAQPGDADLAAPSNAGVFADLAQRMAPERPDGGTRRRARKRSSRK